MADRALLYRREFLRRSALAAASVAVLSCAPGTTTASPTARASASPVRGGTLTFGQWDKIDSIDPALTTGAAAGEVAQNILDTLVTMDADQKFYPALATKWSIEDGGKKFTFTLRDGVKTHDGGTITADAVKRSFERILDPKLKAGAVVSLIGPLDAITTPDAKTVVFAFKQPYYAFMLQIWRYFFGILSPKYLDSLKPGDSAVAPVGSGPFKFANRSADGVVTLEAFADYAWGNETFTNRAAPYLRTVKFRAITDASTRVATLESGENLLIDEVTEADYARLKADKKYTFVNSPRASHTLGFFMNVTRAPTDDRAVREAVNWAVDRKSIVEKLFFGVHKVSVGPLSEGVWARLDEIEKSLGFDPAKAKSVLENAGWKAGTSGPIREKGGQKLEILLATFRSPWTDIAEAMQSQLRDVGIDLKVQKMERGPYLDYVRAYKHNMAATASTSVDPDGVLRIVYHSSGRGSGSNFANVNDTALDALLVKGQSQELGTAERRKTYEDAQRRVMEILPYVGVMSQVRVEAMSTKVHGFRAGPDGLTGAALNDVWVEA
ncbi:MAG TPA: ABC transporter substrate-binding protein [Candidatus Limnocylindria bacterium]|nr:ABC transporter substrate-binding protein [Candidatus Limnocylindria bacterium]